MKNCLLLLFCLTLVLACQKTKVPYGMTMVSYENPEDTLHYFIDGPFDSAYIFDEFKVPPAYGDDELYTIHIHNPGEAALRLYSMHWFEVHMDSVRYPDKGRYTTKVQKPEKKNLPYYDVYNLMEGETSRFWFHGLPYSEGDTVYLYWTLYRNDRALPLHIPAVFKDGVLYSTTEE